MREFTEAKSIVEVVAAIRSNIALKKALPQALSLAVPAAFLVIPSPRIAPKNLGQKTFSVPNQTQPDQTQGNPHHPIPPLGVKSGFWLAQP